jgi:hypothetical protein
VPRRQLDASASIDNQHLCTCNGSTLGEIGRLIAADQPSGLIFHSSGPIEGGWGDIDFWKPLTNRVSAAIALRRKDASQCWRVPGAIRQRTVPAAAP